MFCLVQGLYLTHVHQLEVVLDTADNLGTMADTEIEVDDAETVGELIHQREKAGRERMDTAKGKGMEGRSER